MAKFSGSDKLKILILDCKATTGIGLDARSILWSRAQATRLGAYVEYQHYESGVPDSMYLKSAGWDLIIVPWLGSHGNDFSNFTTALSRFEDSTIPVSVVAVYALTGYLGTATPATGLTVVAAGSSAADRISSEGMKNWEGRLPGRVSFHGQPYTGWDGSVTVHCEDDANNLCVWSKSVEGHPCLFNVSYSGGNSTSNSVNKTHMSFQWMCDQQSTSDKNSQVKDKLNPMYLFMRWDLLQNTDARTAFDAGYLQTTYDKLLPYMSEIHIAAFGWFRGTFPSPSNSYPQIAQWVLDNEKAANGGMFIVHNHKTDIFDIPAEQCSSDHIALDQFVDAGIAYEADCDDLTSYGYTLGTNGYGAGGPVVINGNDLDYPCAVFLGGGDNPHKVWDPATSKYYGGYGCSPWVVDSEVYPTLPSGVQNKIRHPRSLGGNQLTFSNKADSYNVATNLNISGNWNLSFQRMLILGGGFYYHGLKLSDAQLGGYATEFGQMYTCFPDIIKNDYAGFLEAQERGIGSLFKG